MSRKSSMKLFTHSVEALVCPLSRLSVCAGLGLSPLSLSLSSLSLSLSQSESFPLCVALVGYMLRTLR